MPHGKMGRTSRTEVTAAEPGGDIQPLLFKADHSGIRWANWMFALAAKSCGVIFGMSVMFGKGKFTPEMLKTCLQKGYDGP